MTLSQNITGKVHECFESFWQAHNCPGLVYAITLKGSVVHARSFGNRRRSPDAPMTKAAISRIASMTKSFAAVAALRLSDAGLLDLGAPLSSLAPALRLAEPFASASLRDLMAMKLDLVTDDPWADRLLGASNEEIDPYFAEKPIRAGLGSFRCAYSNLSYFLLGRIIAIASGRPLMDYVSDEILSPLRMRSTVWNPPEALDGFLALGYRADRPSPIEEERYTCRSDAAAFGGLWSSVEDLAVWLEFLRAADGSPTAWDSVLCLASRRELSLPYSSYGARPFESAITGHPFDTSASYGFGLVRGFVAGMETLSHSGGIPGYGSHMRVEVTSGYGVVALANSTYCPVWNPCTDALLLIASSLGAVGAIDPKVIVTTGQRLADSILAGTVSDQQALFTRNFWLDNPQDLLDAKLKAVLSELGDGVRVSRVNCRSGFQGEVAFVGSLRKRELAFQLAPHAPVKIQHLSWL